MTKKVVSVGQRPLNRIQITGGAKALIHDLAFEEKRKLDAEVRKMQEEEAYRQYENTVEPEPIKVVGKVPEFKMPKSIRIMTGRQLIEQEEQENKGKTRTNLGVSKFPELSPIQKRVFLNICNKHALLSPEGVDDADHNKKLEQSKKWYGALKDFPADLSTVAYKWSSVWKFAYEHSNMEFGQPETRSNKKHRDAARRARQLEKSMNGKTAQEAAKEKQVRKADKSLVKKYGK